MKNNQPLKVVVDRELEDLVPVFLKNRHKEVDTLKAALAAADFEQLRQLGHRMKGVGNSYGFEHVSVFGRQIEDGARSGDRAGLPPPLNQKPPQQTRRRVAQQ